MKHLPYKKYIYVLTYTCPQTGYHRVQVETNIPAITLTEVINQIRNTGYTGPIKISKYPSMRY